MVPADPSTNLARYCRAFEAPISRFAAAKVELPPNKGTPQGASTVVVSEPLDKEQHSWETVPESSLLHVSDGALSVSPLQLA